MADGNRAFALLKEIAYERVSGTPAEKKAAQRLLEEIHAIGVQGKLEPFEVQEGIVSKATFEVLEPYHKVYEISGYERSANTAEDGEVLDFVYVEDGLDANLQDVKGKLVMLNGRPTYEVYEKMQKAGIRGFITYSGSIHDTLENSDLDRRKLRPLLSDAFGFAVCAHMRVSDAMELVRDKAAKVKINVQNENITLTSHNVCAEIRGTKHPEEIVSFGAHYDSVPFSTGVFDNGSGSVIIMELLRYFHSNPPARTVKFMWYGSEEQGLLGSKQYVKEHADELDKHLLMINVDVAGPILGGEFCTVTGEQKVVEYIDGMMKEAGFAVNLAQNICSSDSTPFADRGIPAVNFGRGGAGGASFMHDRRDTLEFISPDALQKTCDVLELFSERVINAKLFPIAKKIPPEIIEKIDKYLKKKKE